MRRRTFTLLAGVTIVTVASLGVAQRRNISNQRSDYPTWENDPEFSQDIFTFARINYGGRSWDNDFPDGDWNLSFRLQELTSLEVHPNGKVLRLTDPELAEYPFVYMSNFRKMNFSSPDAAALRQYLLNGGFLMMDDNWTHKYWYDVRDALRRVFPNRKPRELPLDHPIFHIVYDLKEFQVPSYKIWIQGETFETWHGSPNGDPGPHYYGIFDDQDRLMVLVCHNNDIGDGWEREGEGQEYFRRYSEQVSYPLAINIITYAMTH